MARGLHVIGTASERNFDALRALGVVPIAYGPGLAERVAEVAPEGVDGAADLAGKGSLETLLELVGDPAKVVTIVDGRGCRPARCAVQRRARRRCRSRAPSTTPCA